MSNDAMREALEVIRDHVTGTDNPLWRTEGHVTVMRRLISGLCESALATPAQSEAKPVAWLSSFIHRHPDPHWRRIYTAHTSEKRARDYVSDLIDPKVEPLYTAPSAAPAGDGGKRIRFIDRAIVQEERACRVEDMLIDLVNQIRKTSPVDDHGHSTTMNAAYLKAVKYLDDAARHAPTGADALEGWQFKKSSMSQYWVVLTPEGGFALARDADDERSSSRVLAQLAAVLAKRGGA